MTKALILIADGTEEIEFTTPYDVFVRAGIDVKSAFIDPAGSRPSFATCSRGVKIVPDLYFEDLKEFDYDALLIPGGLQGAKTMSESTAVQKLVREFQDKKKVVGMICAGTLTALKSDLPRQPITSHPSVKKDLEHNFEYSEDHVVVSGTLVTSRGPGTALLWALKLAELLVGKAKVQEITTPLMAPQ